MKDDLEIYAQMAKEGKKKALENLIYHIQDRIFSLAIRMLYSPCDAEDATQEILIKIITHLSDFRGACSFKTWMFRIATNHLLNCKRSFLRHKGISFEKWESEIVTVDAGYWRESLSEAQQAIVVEEIRISCLQGLLLCLDVGHRVAYILSEIFDMNSRQGAEVLGITRDAFRKRTSRARMKIRNFMQNNCSLINEENPCYCRKEAVQQTNTGEVDPCNLMFATHPCRIKNRKDTFRRLKEFSEIERIAMLFKENPGIASPDFAMPLMDMLSSKKFTILGA